MTVLKKVRYRNRNKVASYLSDEVFDVLCSLTSELGMSASSLLELGVMSLLAKKTFIAVAQGTATGEYICTKELLKSMVVLEVNETVARCNKMKDSDEQ